ncbi:hypothetical protein Tco_0414514 [Tanacetum coccineum]
MGAPSRLLFLGLVLRSFAFRSEFDSRFHLTAGGLSVRAEVKRRFAIGGGLPEGGLPGGGLPGGGLPRGGLPGGGLLGSGLPGGGLPK